MTVNTTTLAQLADIRFIVTYCTEIWRGARYVEPFSGLTMQDIIEGDNIPLWRLVATALRAAAILTIFLLTRGYSHWNEAI